MTPRGRPRNSQPSIRVAIAGRLHPEYDADILAWLDAIPKGQRMNAFKTVLRNGGQVIGLSHPIDTLRAEEVQIAADSILSHWDF